MKRTTFTKAISLLLLCAMLVGTFAINVFAEESAETPAAEIVSENVFFGETLQLMFAVKADDGVDYTLTVTDASGESVPVELYLDEDGNTVEAKGGIAYITKIGVPAQNIADEVTVAVTVDGEIVDQKNYSVLEYLYTRLFVSENVTDAQRVLYNALIAYADASDLVLNNGEDETATTVSDYKFVKFTNVTVGGEDSIITLAGELDLTEIEGIEIPEGYNVVWTVEKYNDSGVSEGTSENVKTVTVEDSHLILTASTVDASAVIEIELATFEFGDNGAAAHKDGGTDKDTYSETNNGYTLNITGGSKMYPSSYDAKGNSCIKLGTSSAPGEFTFTVEENVTKVIINIAGYKATTAKITVNGTAYTVSTLSNNGEYTFIEVDTTSTKTVTFTTVSGGCRAMMNSIVFIGLAE